MNILLWIAYKGTRYAGFQVQKNGVTVCETLQNAMQAVLGVRPAVKGCSRTDAGVHARQFALNFWYDGAVPLAKLPLAFNANLPPDIRVLAAYPVAESFHARYAAHSKTYRYRIRNGGCDSPFDAEYTYRVAPPLDMAAMQATAAAFVGQHDFMALCAAGSAAAAHGDTVRQITRCQVARAGALYTITVTADGYLYNMVRILAGTVLAAGLGKFDPAGAAPLLASRNPQKAGPTLPPQGLFLWQVDYGDAALAPPDLDGDGAEDASGAETVPETGLEPGLEPGGGA
ncbi:MAG: tRNA pseudouridine(38-40) synthase TruA [Gemmiger sp.]|nr:tRNA pseudouridine(38-40) synthase TruA [Gemmiger sp.]